MDKNIKHLSDSLKGAKLNEPMSDHTYLKIGGPADLYFEAKTIEEFVLAVRKARELFVPLTILGQGSNILVSDKGIRGLVLINKSSTIEVLGQSEAESKTDKAISRWDPDRRSGSFKYEFKDLDYDETDYPRIRVRMDSGVDLPHAMISLTEKGITGLQWYSGIPGSIGGAVFNNIHGGTHFMSEILESVNVLDKNNEIKELDIQELGTDYDKSRFQETGEIILTATYKLFKGDKEKAEYVIQEWGKRKSLQPRNAPGCAFHNLTQEQKQNLGIPTTSAGYIVEHMLKMTGFAIGDAAISEAHHNFIINRGKATAADYLSVMKEIYKRAKEQYDIKMVPEIFFIGFDESEIKEFKRKELIELRKIRNKEIRTVYNNSKKMFAQKESEQ